MRDLLLSGTVLTAFLGGVVALLAPCCVSVMLPAYFAATFARRSRILAMTLVFALGVATVILPIGLGATLISRLLVGQHFAVYSVMGLLMLAGGPAMALGWSPRMPMPGMRSSATGPGGVFVLGVFSGVASACCAPVLAGVAAVSGAVASFPAALAVGVAYVFGMVAPLTVLALVWDRRDWGAGRLLAAMTRPVRVGARRIPLASVLSGALLGVMGVLTLVLAVTGPDMGERGWQLQVTAALGHAATGIGSGLSWLPGWASTLAVFAALAAVVFLAARRRPAPVAPECGTASTPLEDSDIPPSRTSPVGTDSVRPAVTTGPNAPPSEKASQR
jgi:cytochrome c biogenesis protein CcdA